MWQISPHPVPCRIKMARKYTLSHKNFAKIHCFKRTLNGILPQGTLSHNFLINCITLWHDFSQKRTPCRILFTVKGHPIKRHIPSSQIWEYPFPRTGYRIRNDLSTYPVSNIHQILYFQSHCVSTSHKILLSTTLHIE